MGLQHMPQRRFLLQMPFGKEKHQLLELQEVAGGGNTPAEHTHTHTHGQRLPGSRGIQHCTMLGSSLHPCPGLQKPQSRATSPGAQAWQVPAGMAFSRPPPPSFGKISLFLCWMGRGP